MECERFDELIYLHIDGRLDEKGERLLREHCETCERCARKLALQKTFEERAGQIEIEEPSPEYWSTFSSRVIERLDTEREGTPARGFKKILGRVFSFPASRPRLATGIASVVIVVAVGALYLNRRGGEIVPPRPSIERMREVEHVRGGGTGEKGPPADRLKKSEDRRADEIGAEEEIPGMEPSGKRDSGKDNTVVGKQAVPVPPASSEVSVKEEAGETGSAVSEADDIPVWESKKKEEPSNRDAVVALEEKGGETPVDEALETAPAEQADAEAAVFGRRPDKTAVSMKTRGARTGGEAAIAASPGGAIDYFSVNGISIPRIVESDTFLTEKNLKELIRTWTEYISENPNDALCLHGYEQASTAYLLLARSTRDEAMVREGSRIVEDYAGRADDPKLRATLLEILHKIRAFQKK